MFRYSNFPSWSSSADLNVEVIWNDIYVDLGSKILLTWWKSYIWVLGQQSQMLNDSDQ